MNEDICKLLTKNATHNEATTWEMKYGVLQGLDSLLLLAFLYDLHLNKSSYEYNNMLFGACETFVHINHPTEILRRIHQSLLMIHDLKPNENNTLILINEPLDVNFFLFLAFFCSDSIIKKM